MLPYRGGSVIYFQGDMADKICIVQQGSVRVTYQNIETGNDEHETLQPGEFFGVKSALGHYNREENAVAIQDSVIMTMTVSEFEQFAIANTRIAMKMLKVFSNQLRRVHRQVSGLMLREEQLNPEIGLFKVGEYYLKSKRYAQAQYVFSRYLTYYPSGAKVALAAEGLETAESALSRSRDAKTAVPSPSDKGFIADVDGSFAVGEESSNKDPQVASENEAAAESTHEQFDTVQAYNDAQNLISQNQYKEAYSALQRIIGSGSDLEYTVKSSFDLGCCLFFMGKFNDCIMHLGQVISRYPKHPELGSALFFIGQAYEKIGRRDQAAAFYKKILNLIPSEEDSVHVKAKQALKDLGA
jgi:CRP-like cAMP-binding protein